MSNLFKPSVPTPPPPPPPPPAPPMKAVKPAEVERQQRKMRDPKRLGRQRTIVTGPRGLTSENGDERIYSRTLIGSIKDDNKGASN
jgi:hypothetical protein